MLLVFVPLVCWKRPAGAAPPMVPHPLAALLCLSSLMPVLQVGDAASLLSRPQQELPSAAAQADADPFTRPDFKPLHRGVQRQPEVAAGRRRVSWSALAGSSSATSGVESSNTPFWLSESSSADVERSEVEQRPDPINTNSNSNSRKKGQRKHQHRSRSQQQHQQQSRSRQHQQQHHHNAKNNQHHPDTNQQHLQQQHKKHDDFLSQYASLPVEQPARQQQPFRFDDPSPFANPALPSRRRHRNRDQEDFPRQADGSYKDDVTGYQVTDWSDSWDDDGESQEWDLKDSKSEDMEEEEQLPGFRVSAASSQQVQRKTYYNDYQGDQPADPIGEEEEDYGEDTSMDYDEQSEEQGSSESDPPRARTSTTQCAGCRRKATAAASVRTTNEGTAPAASRRLSDEQIAERRIERIKQQILAKLRLSAPPNATRRHRHLPEPLTRIEHMMGDQAPAGNAPYDDPDDFYGRTTQVVTFATTIHNCPRDRSLACFHLDVAGKVDTSDVKSAVLWVYKEADSGDARGAQTLVFSKIAGQHHNVSRVGKEIGHKVVRNEPQGGWVSFNIKRLVGRWLAYPERNLGVAVSCKTCRDVTQAPVSVSGDRQAFLVIHTSVNHQVYRRSTNDCSAHSGNECCRERFYVDFAKIGWTDWVMYPPGYWANYCKGTCHGDSPISPKYQHSNLMQQVAIVEQDEELSPCCAPRKMSQLSLLYFMDDVYMTKHLPNMVVESCSCT